MNTSELRFAAPAALVVIACAVGPFLPVLDNQLALDDALLIEQNPRIQNPWDAKAIWQTDYWFAAGVAALNPDRDLLYRPLVTQLFALIYAAAGPSPLPYHVAGVVVHALVCLAVFALTWRLFGRKWLALVTAVIFAVHPGHAEAVIAVVGLADTLSTFFLLLGLLLFVRWNGRASTAVMVVSRIAATLCFAASMLCKESGVAFVALLPLCMWWAVRRRSNPLNDQELPAAARAEARGSLNQEEQTQAPMRGAAIRKSLLIDLAVWVIVTAVVLGAYFPLRSKALHGQWRQTQPPDMMANVLVAADGAEHVWTRLAFFGEYLRLAFWPAQLSCDYSYDAVPIATSAADPRVVRAIVAIGVVGVASVASLWFGGGVLFAALFFGATYALPSNAIIVFRTMVAERLLYLPLLPLIWIVLLPIAALLRRLSAIASLERVLPIAAVGAVLAVVLPASIRTVLRTHDWQDNEQLYLADSAAFPRCARLQMKRGIAFGHYDQWDEARAAIDRAIDIAPGYLAARAERMKLDLRFGRLDDALNDFTYLIVEHGPNPAYVAQQIAGRRLHAAATTTMPAGDDALRGMLAAGDLDGAAAELLTLPPTIDGALTLAAAKLLTWHPVEAASLYEQVLGHDPNNAEAAIQLALFTSQMDPMTARTLADKAAALAPEDGLVQLGVSCVYWVLGDKQSAADKWLEIARTLPRDDPVRRVVVRILPPDAPI